MGTLMYRRMLLACAVILGVFFIYVSFFRSENRPPQWLPIVQHQPNDVRFYNHSLIDAYPPNPARFPAFKRAISYRIVLTPGRSVFIPAGWWHWVFSEEHCIAISHVIRLPADVSKKQAVFRATMFGIGGSDLVQSPSLAGGSWPRASFHKPVRYSTHHTIDFEQHIVDSTPFVHEDPNLRRITDELLTNTLHDVNLLLSKTETCNPAHKPNNETIQIVNGTYHDFVQWDHSTFSAYIGMTPLSKRTFTPYLNRDWNEYVTRAGYPDDVYLWHSQKRTETGLHYDTTDNLLTVHSGKKTVLLFPPSETDYLYNVQLTNGIQRGYVVRRR